MALKKQLELIEGNGWDVLCILDACRADAFLEVVGSGEAVYSPASRTDQWFETVQPILREKHVTYFTAHPLPVLRGTGFEAVNVYDRHWGLFGADDIPGVHAMSVNGVVLTWQEFGRLKFPIVVHYLQPHFPAIGCPMLRVYDGQPLGPATGKWRDALLAYAGKRPQMLADTDVTPEQLRAAHTGGIRLGYDAVRQLARALAPRRVVVTADHGELLGESGIVGHLGSLTRDMPELRHVPWLEVPATPEGDVHDKLRALGYE